MAPVILIQARLGSTRLPGKVMLPAAGKPLIGHLLDRLEKLPFHKVVSMPSRDLPELGEYVLKHGGAQVHHWEGRVDDVAGRFLDYLNKHPAVNAFVRICADSPLIDPWLVDRAVADYSTGLFNVVTNTVHKSYPAGQCVEVVQAEALKVFYDRMLQPEREHVTPYFYSGGFTVRNFVTDPPQTDQSMVVDTQDDYEKIKTLIEDYEPTRFRRATWRELLLRLRSLGRARRAGIIYKDTGRPGLRSCASATSTNPAA